jgi:nitroreductase
MGMDFDEVLIRRRSNRRFKDEQIKKAELDRLLLAGCSAPVGSNLYRDLHMTVVQDKKILHALNAAFGKRLQDREAVKKITGDMPRTARDAAAILPFYGAPTVIILSHRSQELQPGIEYANTACVAMAMHLAAVNLGLGSVLAWGALEAMRIYPELDNSALLGLPEGFVPLMGLMVGYPAAPPAARDLDPEKIAVDYIGGAASLEEAPFSMI